MALERFIKPSVATERQANRAAISRELLGLLGSHLDLEPDRLLALKDSVRDDWTLAGGADTVAAADRGGVEMAQYQLRLDAQNENGSYRITPSAGVLKLPAGAYVLRVRAKDSATVAGDLGVKVRNVTDSTDVLAEVTKTLTTSYAVYEFPFSVRAADDGDTLDFTLTKKQATANTVLVDYVAIQPLDAKAYPWGKVPEGGRKDGFTYGADGLTAFNIHDAAAGGNVVEAVTLTYASGDLSTVVRVRSGRTLTETYTYASGNLDKVTHAVT